MKNQKREILVFVENYCAHPNTELTSIKLMCLPPQHNIMPATEVGESWSNQAAEYTGFFNVLMCC